MLMRENPVLFIHIGTADKKALFKAAKKHGMKLTTYCRMILLGSLREAK